MGGRFRLRTAAGKLRGGRSSGLWRGARAPAVHQRRHSVVFDRRCEVPGADEQQPRLRVAQADRHFAALPRQHQPAHALDEGPLSRHPRLHCDLQQHAAYVRMRQRRAQAGNRRTARRGRRRLWRHHGLRRPPKADGIGRRRGGGATRDPTAAVRPRAAARGRRIPRRGHAQRLLDVAPKVFGVQHARDVDLPGGVTTSSEQGALVEATNPLVPVLRRLRNELLVEAGRARKHSNDNAIVAACMDEATLEPELSPRRLVGLSMVQRPPVLQRCPAKPEESPSPNADVVALLQQPPLDVCGQPRILVLGEGAGGQTAPARAEPRAAGSIA
mmetsp:Transcript_114989/g.332260  ORF Transcript_114989/g.332260 Transcript_114989/m.332260 type:complete len:329 (+) Transcript_114989:350-1336(+)